MQNDASPEQLPGHISIHNKRLFQDLTSSVDSKNSSHPESRQHARDNKSSHSLNRSQSETNTKKQESKKKKILKYHSELEKWRKNDLKRTLEMIEFKKNKEEAHFRKTLSMIESRGGIYGEVSEVLHKHHSQHLAKALTMHSDWHNNVFHPIRSHIRSASGDEQKMDLRKSQRRSLYDKYLSECNRNGNRIFLDNINAQEYDPFEWTKGEEQEGARTRIRDPLKSDLMKHIVEEKISSQTSKYCQQKKQRESKNQELDSDSFAKDWQGGVGADKFTMKPRTRVCMSPQQYCAVDHLPRYRVSAHVEQDRGKCVLPSHVPGGNVILNQFDVPKYNAAVVRKEFFPQTKRVGIKPASSRFEFNISKQW